MSRHSKRKQNTQTFVPLPLAANGLLRVILRIPSGTFCNVADHDHADTLPPEIGDGSGFVTFAQTMLLCKTVGFPPIPDDDILKDIAPVTLSQFIAVLNWNEISSVVAFASPASASTLASCPGRNFVNTGGGGTHSVTGTSALNPNGSMVTLGKQPWNGG